MNLSRVSLLVEIDLDPLPGFGHDEESWRAYLDAFLDRAAAHYNPRVLTFRTDSTGHIEITGGVR